MRCCLPISLKSTNFLPNQIQWHSALFSRAADRRSRPWQCETAGSGFFPDRHLQDLLEPEYNKVDGAMRENSKKVHKTVTRTHETKQSAIQRAIPGGRPFSKVLSDVCYLHPCNTSRYPSNFKAASIRIEPRSLGPRKKWVELAAKRSDLSQLTNRFD